MLDVKTFDAFIKKANVANQQLFVWLATNNEFAKHQARWNKLDPSIRSFAITDFTRKHGCKYKNFWSIVVPTLQHGWTLGVARLFDPAYHPRDARRERPRISLDLLLTDLNDQALGKSIRLEQTQHQLVIDSLKNYRDNFHAHNDANFNTTIIEAGVEKLFEWLEEKIAAIKKSEPHLNKCGIINFEYNEKLSQCGVDEVFETLLLGEKSEAQ